jgi:uncharacterized iron-regulated membrane protein
MKEHFRHSMSWLHTWCGLTCGWLLCAIFLAGTLSVFREPITRWMEARPLLATATAETSEAALTAALHTLAQQAGTARAWIMQLPERPGDALLLSWRAAGGNRQLALHPDSGEAIPGAWGRTTEGGRHFMVFHYMLHGGTIGFWVVGWIAMCALVSMIAGVVVHKRIFKDFFTFRPGKGQRSWLDAHNVTAVLPLPFLLMIVYTGLTYFYTSLMPLPLAAVYGDDSQAFQRYQAELSEAHTAAPRATSVSLPVPAGGNAVRDLMPLLQAMPALTGGPALRIIIERPGSAATRIRLLGRKPDDGNSRNLLNGTGMALFDNHAAQPLQVTRAGPPEVFASEHIHGVLEQLHVGGFGGWSIKWLYFLSGLMGTLMIATGLVLFVTKRRQKSQQEFGAATTAIYRLIEILNVAAIAGSAFACIGFFYANRLIPAALAGRSGWEIQAFFYLWLGSFLHAAVRPARAAWREQLAATALLCLLLPWLNWFSTGQQLFWYARHGDWQRAGVELTAFACGLMLWFAYRRVSAKPAIKPVKR